MVAGLAVLGILVVVAVLVGVAGTRYQKAKPDEALIATGRGGQKVVIGGGMFIMPVVQQLFRLDLSAQTINVVKRDVITKNRVPINVNANAVFKIKGEIKAVELAAQALWGSKAEGITDIVLSIAEGAFRDICGKMDPEEINEDRTKFANLVTENVTGHLDKIGIDLISFVVNHISDDQGYFEALSARALVEAKQDARQKTATADRTATVTEVEQKRESEVRTAQMEAETYEAQKDRDVKVAQFNATVAAEKAKADQAGPRAEAVATQEVVTEQTKLAERTAERKEAQLKAETIKPAEAERTAAVVKAEGDKQAAVLKGQGTGDAAKAVGEGEAAAIEAKLVAEAQGLFKKAEAMKEFNDSGMELEVYKSLVEKLPAIVEAAGGSLSSIEKIKIVHFTGGGGANGDSPVDSILSGIPKVLGVVDESLQSTLGRGLAELMPTRGPRASKDEVIDQPPTRKGAPPIETD